MKKILKTSLYASLSLSTFMGSNLSANALDEAFANAKVNGEIKAQYFAKESSTGVESNILAIGGNLNLATAPIDGLSAKVTFQTSSIVNDKNVAAYSGDMDGSGAVMSQSYLNYVIKDTTLRYGRQYIGTKLVNGSGSRMIKQSFYGAFAQNKSLADTTLSAAYVTKYQDRTDGDGSVGRFVDYQDGFYTVQAQNGSIENLKVIVEYLNINGKAANSDQNTLYADATYKIPSIASSIAAQTYRSDNDGEDKGSLYGLKVSTSIDALSLTVAYSKQNDGDVTNGVGSNAEQIFTESAFRGGRYAPNLKALQFKVGYDFGNGIKARATTTSWDEDGGTKARETSARVSYAFSKNGSVEYRYGKFTNYSYDNRSRLYVSYKF